MPGLTYSVDISGLRDGQTRQRIRSDLIHSIITVRVLCLRIASRPYFWRVQGRHEVDFEIESGAEVIAVEVKAATRFDSGDLAGLKAFLAV